MLLKAINLDLLKKYDTPAPRYTSYPTAPVFTVSFDAKAYQSAIIQNNPPGSAEQLSLYLHIPFCDSLCYFCGCTTLITKWQSTQASSQQQLATK
jgi:oxygen-independent coproporphyrinogen-3 oxidase